MKNLKNFEMQIKNPFKVLGIDVNIVKNLSFDEAQQIIKAQYHALQQIFHPDKGGNETKSKEINEAYSLLKNPKNYEYFTSTLLKKRKSHKEEELKILEDKVDNLSDLFLEYLENFSFKNKNSIFNTPLKLNMYDYALYMVVYNKLIFYRKEETMKLFYNMIVKKDGAVKKIRKYLDKNGKARSKIEFFPNKRVIGVIENKEIIEQYLFSLFSLFKKFKILDEEKMLEGYSSKTPYFQNKIPPDRFKNIITLLEPEIKKDAYLFSINKEKDSIYFSLEGKIIEILG